QLLLQPTQVDVHQLRLRRLLRRRPQSPDPDPQRPPRIPAQPGHGIRRGDRLPRLAHPARPPLSCPAVVVRDPPLRSRRPATSHPGARGVSPAIRRMGKRRRPLRTSCPRAAKSRLLPSRSRRRRQPNVNGTPQPLRPPLPYAHEVERPFPPPLERGTAEHPTPT